MFRKHVVRHLSEYHDDELSAAGKIHVEAHLRTCSKCRAALEEIRFASRLASSLSLSAAPELEWSESPAPVRMPLRRRFLPAVLLAGLVFGTALLVFWTRPHIPAAASWEVTGLPGKSRLQPGEVLQTDSSSQ